MDVKKIFAYGDYVDSAHVIQETFRASTRNLAEFSALGRHGAVSIKKFDMLHFFNDIDHSFVNGSFNFLVDKYLEKFRKRKQVVVTPKAKKPWELIAGATRFAHLAFRVREELKIIMPRFRELNVHGVLHMCSGVSMLMICWTLFLVIWK